MTPQTPTFTAAQLRENAAYIRRHGYVDQADMLEFAADRLAHEEQHREFSLIHQKYRAIGRDEGRAEVYAEIAKLVNAPWQIGETKIERYNRIVTWLRAQYAVAQPAPDGVD